MVCTCPTSPSDLPIQEEICNIGNSLNSTTKCLTPSFIYICLSISLFFSFTDSIVSPKCISLFGPARLFFLLLFLMGVRELYVRLNCSPEPSDAGVDTEAGVEDGPAR